MSGGIGTKRGVAPLTLHSKRTAKLGSGESNQMEKGKKKQKED